MHQFVLIIGMCWATTLVAQPFLLDTTFRANFDTWNVNDIQPTIDGKIFLSGQIKFDGDQSFRRCAKLLGNGELDTEFPTFSQYTGGGTITPWEDNFYVNAGGLPRRLGADFLPDPLFQPLYNDPYFAYGSGGDYHVYPDGSLVIGGTNHLDDPARGFVGLYNFIWFTNTGRVDTTKTHRTGNGHMTFFKELPDGKFIAYYGGNFYDGRPTSYIMRMHADGGLDTTFNTGVDWGFAFSFLPLADGRVYVGGVFTKADMPNDTLHLIRFMPDGSLDPTFNNFHGFGIQDLDGVTGSVSTIYPIDGNKLIVTGAFETIDGIPHNSIAFFDTTGTLLDLGESTGCGNYDYFNYTYGTISGITPNYDSTAYYIWGAYHGYNDGITNDTLQRFVSRLTLVDLALGKKEPEVPARQFSLYPNPAYGDVTLSFDLPRRTNHGHVTVTDATGRTMATHKLSGQQGQVLLDTRGWGAGLYTIACILDGTVVQTEKLMVP